LEGYDYLIDTSGSPESIAELLSGRSPTATVISLAAQAADDNRVDSPALVYAAESPAKKHVQEALRLVSSRMVSLEDHTASVEPLEAYKKAWEDLRSGKQFNVLLSVSRELEDL
jgi:threonine dehydrogenase-like Zn-dependent dehydrogenase